MTLSAIFGRMWGFLDDLHLRRRAVQRIWRGLGRIRSVRSSFLRALASPARLRGASRVSISFDACEEGKGELVSLRSEVASTYCRDFLAGPSWPQGARTCPPWPAWAAAFARVGQGGRFSPKPGRKIIFFERAKAQTALKALRRNGARRPDRNIKACARKCVLTGAYHPPKPRPGTSGLE